MHINSRRSFMSTAAVAVTASLPGCSAMAPAAASIIKAAPNVPAIGSDAELLHLGRRFDYAHAEWLLAWRRWREAEARWVAELDARSLSFRENWAACWALAHETGREETADESEAALEKLNAVSAQIEAISATTIVGLAVKAKVTRQRAVSPYTTETPVEEIDYGIAALLAFFAEVEALASASA